MIADRDELRQAVSDAEMKSAADAMAKVKVILQKVRQPTSDPLPSRRLDLSPSLSLSPLPLPRAVPPASLPDSFPRWLLQVYASLGEEFVDGEEFDGAVVRGAIKRSILIAMKS